MHSNRTTLRWLRDAGVLVVLTLLCVHTANAEQQDAGPKDTGKPIDLAQPQVLLETRIVDSSSYFDRSLGILWGGDVRDPSLRGNSTGLVFPSILSVSSEAAGGIGSVTPAPVSPHFVVNMPTPIASGGDGNGFIFGFAGDAERLRGRLTSAELGGLLKTVGTFKSVVTDNTPASIDQTTRVPSDALYSGRDNGAFIDARIVSTVTPHVTADGSVLMQISIVMSWPFRYGDGSNGQQTFLFREASGKMLVKSGDTAVIGGLYRRRTSETDCGGRPFYYSVPVLGPLLWERYRRENVADDRAEMLVFITPRIIKPAEPVVASMTVR